MAGSINSYNSPTSSFMMLFQLACLVFLTDDSLIICVNIKAWDLKLSGKYLVWFENCYLWYKSRYCSLILSDDLSLIYTSGCHVWIMNIISYSCLFFPCAVFSRQQGIMSLPEKEKKSPRKSLDNIEGHFLLPSPIPTRRIRTTSQ